MYTYREVQRQFDAHLTSRISRDAAFHAKLIPLLVVVKYPFQK